MSRGKFIVFEGIDGSGKTTVINSVNSYLESIGCSVFLTREPTDNRVGSMIRKFIKGEGDYELDERVIAALFAADRLDHILRPGGINEKLGAGVNVICDRFWLSSCAYQTGAFPMEYILELNKGAMELVQPDLTVYLSVDVSVALSRVDARGEEREHYESRERLGKISRNYEKAIGIRKEADNIVIVDASRDEAAILDEVSGLIKNIIS
ncbi:MAG: dTMP kinase [Clostridiales bacterium]|jgi:dTMP kinase|nr:dTMP kinase [Clostridiales bacterium]